MTDKIIRKINVAIETIKIANLLIYLYIWKKFTNIHLKEIHC